ncbi:MAG TPA: hypothetical protein VJC00_00410, partial [Candidatus Nanoarchaeia archaeon]|nr:hypothetical protein [Candidatus Nanoarchaeia archaeon]
AEKEQNISQNPVVIMYKGDVVSFTIKGEKRSLRLDKLYFDKANLSILSANENFIMFVNDSRMLDLDGDGIDDLTIILSSIGGAAVFHLQEITIGVAEEVSITPEEVIKPGEEKPSEEERPPVEEKPSIIFDIGKKALKYIGLAAVAMAIMISLVLGALSYSNFIGNVSKAENYVRDALVRGVPKATIKRKMTEAGWEDQVVDSILKMESQIMTRKDLERKITEAVKEGLSREEIKKSLIEKGWKESDVERLLK